MFDCEMCFQFPMELINFKCKMSFGGIPKISVNNEHGIPIEV